MLLSADLTRHCVRPHECEVSNDLIHDLESDIGMKIITKRSDACTNKAMHKIQL